MIIRQLLSNCCFILLLVPTLAWALNESETSPAGQSASGESAPVQPAPEQTTPAKPAPAPVVPAKPPRVLTAPAKPAPVQSVPMQSAPMQTAPTSPARVSPADATAETIDIEVFVREDCLQCGRAKEFLAKLQNLQPQLKIITLQAQRAD